jgi:copper chaperone NosL
MKGKVLGGIVIIAVLCLVLPALAQKAEKATDIQKHANCKYCGMDRDKFNYSRMLINYSDGSEFGACSLHCAALDLALSLDKMPASLQVADYNSKKLIDAEKASWVIGGKKPGVMTKVAKWAFDKPEDAMAFIKENEGKVASFDDAVRATFEDMYSDVKMIRAKRAKMKVIHQEKKP